MKRSRISPSQAARRIHRYLKSIGSDPNITADSIVNARLASIGYQVSPGYVSKLAKKSIERGNDFPRKMDPQIGRAIWQATIREWALVIYPPDIHIRPSRRGKR